MLGRLVQAPDPRDEGLPVGARHGDPQHQLQEPVQQNIILSPHCAMAEYCHQINVHSQQLSCFRVS